MADDENSRSIGVDVLLFVLGTVVLAYVGGAFSATFETFPYPQLLEKPFKALEATSEKQKVADGSVLNTGLWHESRFENSGVVRHSPDKSYGDYTLYTSGDYAGAYLLDAEGEIVHQWEAPFREVFPDHPQVEEPVPETHIYWRRAQLFPNGDIVASYSGEGDTPYGYGLVRVDSESNVIWKYTGNVHHDFDVRDDGSVVALSHEFRRPQSNPIRGLPQFNSTILEDYLVELSPDGNEQRKVSLIDALVRSPFRAVLEMYPTFIDRGYESPWDPLHTNTAEILGAGFADHHAFAEPGEVMVSFRNVDTVAIVDMDGLTVTWASRGFWRQQHHPEPMDNGRFLLFDNNGQGGPGGSSRIVEFDPANQSIPWAYRGTHREPFWSIGRGSLQSLPNGNVLITESAGGRIFEITRKGEIVWQFHNPSRKTNGETAYVAITCSGLRYTADELDFVQ